MLKISRLSVENADSYIVTDAAKPRFGYAVESDGQNVTVKKAVLRVGKWSCETTDQLAIPYEGPALQPYTVYRAGLTVTASTGETATRDLVFETGKLGDAWQAQWISDPAYTFTEKLVSPKPMTFRKRFAAGKKVASARLYATAMGIYELKLNGKKVGDEYFAPGFTSYKTTLLYQTYDVTDMLAAENELIADVAGGWAVGAFVFTRKNRVTADRQALLAELRVTYEDGTSEIIGTDPTWEVCTDGPYRMVDLYDGETYDATVTYDALPWHAAAVETLKISPKLIAFDGEPVRAHEVMKPVKSWPMPDGSTVYDFGQNFAGVVSLDIDGKKGQKITVRHAEIVDAEGQPNYAILRSAKATAEYTCGTDGKQHYSPTMSYMGFRYIQVWGIEPEKLEVAALALYSDITSIGRFECSNELINRLESNIIWSSRSNFIDIPTDCPQRDERMGWTGDICVFAPTACFHYDMSRFLNKWLRDVVNEQLPSGGIPNTVPIQGYGFPATMPAMAVAFWGDACVMVPWALYQATGDRQVLRSNYDMMKKYIKACRFWAGFGVGKGRYIWQLPGVLTFGDWLAPDSPKMSQWQARNKWTGTASLKNTSALVSKIAGILGEKEDEKKYADLSAKVADAYRSLLTDGNGKLKTEFQTGYVLPIHMGIFEGEEKKKAAENLARLVKDADYCIATGFPGTPYILFALADNGQEETAFRMLTNTKCPSWLYEVRVGGTTIWERWNGLGEDGLPLKVTDGTDNMISYNHYASGAVGDFLYRRVAGLEAVEPAYRRFRVKPLIGGGITSASASVETPYGEAASDWKLADGTFTVNVKVPVGTECTVVLPDGTEQTYGSGEYTASCAV